MSLRAGFRQRRGRIRRWRKNLRYEGEEEVIGNQETKVGEFLKAEISKQIIEDLEYNMKLVHNGFI